MDAKQAPSSSADEPSVRVVVIVTGGDGIDAGVVRRLPTSDFTIAADSGLDHALTHGLTPDLVVGDLDSVSNAALERSQARISQFPRDKDDTDLALAVAIALERQPELLVIAGGVGQRLSHVFGNVAAIVSAAFTTRVRWESNATTLEVATPGAAMTISGEPGELVSLLSYGGEATGVTTTGLRWGLDNADLSPTTTRGVSNELVNSEATVAVGVGVLLVIHERMTS